MPRVNLNAMVKDPASGKWVRYGNTAAGKAAEQAEWEAGKPTRNANSNVRAAWVMAGMRNGSKSPKLRKSRKANRKSRKATRRSSRK